MSRRDTILIAVLINAGLLVILFATAMHGGNDPSNENSSSTPAVAAVVPAQPIDLSAAVSAQQPVVGDEVDQVLNQFEKGVMAIQFPDSADAAKGAVEASANVVTIHPAHEEITSVAPAIAQSESPSVKEDFVQVTVKRGDILERIARANGTTVDEIMRANHLPNTKLKIGQVLKVPVGKQVVKKGAPASKPTLVSSDGGEARFYTIKSGDNPWVIANKFRMPLEEFLKLNNLNEDKARKLKPGDKVRVR